MTAELWDVPDELRKQLEKYCEEKQWTAIVEKGDMCTISFYSSLELEAEHIVRGRTLEMAILRALT